MSFIGDMFSGGKGAGFQAQGANPEDAAKVRSSIYQQQDFLHALQAASPEIFGQQQNLTNQLVDQSQGGGPNPALQQLQNTTGQNIASQASLMAGQRGSSANAGLIARQAGLQGGNIEQQAVGQGALMRAQQQLAAQGMLQNQFGQQVGQQANALNSFNQGAQNLYNSDVSMQGGMNSANAGIAQGNQKAQYGLLNGIGGALSAIHFAEGGQIPKPTPTPAYDFSKLFPNPNPEPNKDDTDKTQASMRKAFGRSDGGQIEDPGPKSFFGKMLNGMNSTAGNDYPTMQLGSLGSAIGSIGKAAYNAVNPLIGKQQGKMGQSDITNQMVPQTAYNGGVMDYTSGGKLPGKAEVKGDSFKNDKVPILGSPGEIMLPRSITQHPDAPRKAAEFVQAILARNRGA